MCAQPPALHPANPRLHANLRHQPLHKVCGRYNGNNDETNYRNEVQQLAICAAVERVSSTEFLGVHITEDLSWTTNTASLAKKAQQLWSSAAQNHETLQRIMNAAGQIISATLPSLTDIYNTQLTRKALSVAADPTHPLQESLNSKREERVL
ncbi:hypothetical protein PDJAM_G00154950 [Pangasius djambal]|uniref:Uncharacterized protein n=1 Tax=Pangasius djambal TaxID=1691987 RepID=A0ACC5ZHQ0_9TELE|nr:hypothetical protein [Pangasius djambal]